MRDFTSEAFRVLRSQWLYTYNSSDWASFKVLFILSVRERFIVYVDNLHGDARNLCFYYIVKFLSQNKAVWCENSCFAPRTFRTLKDALIINGSPKVKQS